VSDGASTTGPPARLRLQRGPLLLAVGGVEIAAALPGLADRLPPLPVCIAGYGALCRGEDLLDEVGCVVSPVVAAEFDAIELAMLLFERGFAGAYRAVLFGAGSARLIRAEIRAACPGLDAEILTLAR
jgi:hypothetical protein